LWKSFLWLSHVYLRWFSLVFFKN